MTYSKTKKLAKNYYIIEDRLSFYEDILNEKRFFQNKVRLKKDYKNFCKIIRYMKVYKAVFLKSLKELSEADALIAEEVYVKRKSVCCVAFKNFISESTVYRILKNFNFIFYNNMRKVSRIVNPLIEELNNRKSGKL